MAKKDYDFGEVFHTCLRKYCDSDYSVLAWNVINKLVDNQEWNDFCKYCGIKWLEPNSDIIHIMKSWNGQGMDDRYANPVMTKYLIKCMDKDSLESIKYAFGECEENEN